MLQLQELEADGAKYFTSLNGVNKGFFKINDDQDWEPFQSFEQLPTVESERSRIRVCSI